MLEDYRAGVGIDRADEEADPAAGQRVTCPLLVPSSSRAVLGAVHRLPQRPLDRLRPPHGAGAPDEPAVALITFLRVR
jgi:haloacetate dehalogenase